MKLAIHFPSHMTEIFLKLKNTCSSSFLKIKVSFAFSLLHYFTKNSCGLEEDILEYLKACVFIRNSSKFTRKNNAKIHTENDKKSIKESEIGSYTISKQLKCIARFKN